MLISEQEKNRIIGLHENSKNFNGLLIVEQIDFFSNFFGPSDYDTRETGIPDAKDNKKIQQNFNLDTSNIYSHNKLIDINMESIMWAREKLNIDKPMILSSDLSIKTKSTQRLVDICNKVGATEYISGQGGKNYLDENLFKCKITYLELNLPNYYTIIQNI